MNHHSSHLTGSVQLRLYSPFTPRAVIHGASCVSANMTAVCHLPPPQKRSYPTHILNYHHTVLAHNHLVLPEMDWPGEG